MHSIYWSRVIAVRRLMAGFQDLSLNTPSSTTPTSSASSLSMRMAPFPRHHSAGTAFTANIVRMEIDREWGEERDREMRPGDRGCQAGWVRRGEKWMTDSKKETKTFAQLRVVALRPDSQEMDSLAGREITPRAGKDFLLNFYYRVLENSSAVSTSQIWLPGQSCFYHVYVFPAHCQGANEHEIRTAITLHFTNVTAAQIY